MALTGIQLSSGIVLGATKPLDAKFGPFSSVSQANTEVSTNLRYKGLTIGILIDGNVVEHWYKAGVTDSDLVIKTTTVDGNASLDGGLF